MTQKRIIIIVSCLVLLVVVLPQAALARPQSGAACGYCGNYFIFGDPKPFDECFERVNACFKTSKRMPGQSLDSCMCSAQRDLSKKYPPIYFAQKNVAWVVEAAGGVAGKAIPGVGLIDPDKRDKLLSGKGKNADYLDQLGEFGGGLGKLAGGIAHAVEDTEKSNVQRIATGVAAVLPKGDAQTVAGFVKAVASLRQ